MIAKATTEKTASSNGNTMRIARFLAAAGIASRRACEKLLVEARVEVNGRIVTDPACKLDPARDRVSFDGRVITLPRPCYLLFYKPAGVTCSSRDPHARSLIIDFLPSGFGRLFPIGRLDRDSEGLIICTNDGDFAQRVAHPRYGQKKIYRVFTRGRITRQALAEMERGIVSAGERLQPESVRKVLVNTGKEMVTELEFILVEGKKREIRRLCGSVGIEIVRLIRIGIGEIRDPGLKPGQWRHLKAAEISALKQ